MWASASERCMLFRLPWSLPSWAIFRPSIALHAFSLQSMSAWRSLSRFPKHGASNSHTECHHLLMQLSRSPSPMEYHQSPPHFSAPHKASGPKVSEWRPWKLPSARYVCVSQVVTYSSQPLYAARANETRVGVRGSGYPHLGDKYGRFKRGRDWDASRYSLSL